MTTGVQSSMHGQVNASRRSHLENMLSNVFVSLKGMREIWESLTFTIHSYLHFVHFIRFSIFSWYSFTPKSYIQMFHHLKLFSKIQIHNRIEPITEKRFIREICSCNYIIFKHFFTMISLKTSCCQLFRSNSSFTEKLRNSTHQKWLDP